MKTIRQIFVIINLKTIIVTLLAVASTYFCLKYNFTAEFPLTLVATAVVFPIVFSIGGAYKRRENALAKYSSIKAHGRAMYFAARDWLPEPDEKAQERAKELLEELLVSCRTLFAKPITEMPANEKRVYRCFSQLSIFIKEDLRGRGLPSGEASRCNQFLSKMVTAFEDVKHIYQYRTPRTLRAFSGFFVKVLPIIYGPYYVAVAADYTPGLVY